MLSVIRAERLKMRHTFGRFLPAASALLTLSIALVLSGMGSYYAVNAWNWWYVMLLPGMLAVLGCLGMKREKKIRYYNLLSSPRPPERCLLGKIIYYGAALVWANLLVFLGTSAGGVFMGTYIAPAKGLAAAVLLSVCFLWEIPLYMLLGARFGMFAAVFTCMALSIGGTVFAHTNLWWLCPSSIPARLMCPVLGIMPNGLLVAPDSPLKSAAVIAPGIVLSLVWFIVITVITVKWFARMEKD